MVILVQSKFAIPIQKKFTLRTCNTMTKTSVFTVHLARTGRHSEKNSGNVTTLAQHRIIYICIIYASTEWPKMAPLLYALTSSNINRFSKLFYCQN